MARSGHRGTMCAPLPGITSIAMRVSEWLGLRPGERREAAFGFTVLLLVIGSHAMLETARDSLFLSDLPASRLPWAYLTIAALALALGTFNAQLARLPRSGTLTALLVGGAVVDVGFWWVTAERRPSELFSLYVWTGLIASLVTLQFWLLAGDVFDVGRAKRVFAFVGAGGLAGATLGAGLAAHVDPRQRDALRHRGARRTSMGTAAPTSDRGGERDGRIDAAQHGLPRP